MRQRKYDRNRVREKWAEYYYGPRGTATSLLVNARQRAKHGDVPFDLPRSWVLERVERGFCEVTGLPFVRQPRGNSRIHPFTPSIDRIDRDLGYVPSNCRLVVFIFNQARSDFGDEAVMRMAKALTERQA